MFILQNLVANTGFIHFLYQFLNSSTTLYVQIICINLITSDDMSSYDWLLFYLYFKITKSHNNISSLYSSFYNDDISSHDWVLFYLSKSPIIWHDSMSSFVLKFVCIVLLFLNYVKVLLWFVSRSMKHPTIPKDPKFHLPPHHKKIKCCASWNDMSSFTSQQL